MTSLLSGAAFITGGASGIGKATAFSFARHGAKKIALADVNISAAEAAATELTAAFPDVQALPLNLDVTSEESVDAAIAETVQKFGRIDYAVNAAGIGSSAEGSATYDIADWKKTIDVNLNGVWLSSRAQIQVMLKQEKLVDSPRHNRGVIINVASICGLVAMPQGFSPVAYTAAKHAVIGTTRADATRYASQDIRINAICPGIIRTPMIESSMDSGALAGEIAKMPLGRVGEADELADHITFLASPMSSYMCGAALVVDGMIAYGVGLALVAQ